MSGSVSVSRINVSECRGERGEERGRKRRGKERRGRKREKRERRKEGVRERGGREGRKE